MLYLAGDIRVGVDIQASLRVQTAVTLPPTGVEVGLKRVSPIMPIPTLDDMGRPVDWVEDDLIVEDWGRFQVVFNGVDVTFYRGVPVTVRQVEFTEPFSDSVAVVKFPQLSPFEALPDWLDDWVNVEINLVKPDDSVENVWEGLYASEEDSVQKSAEFTAECIGALYQADMFKKQPSFDLDAHDIGELIADLLNDKVSRRLLRVGFTTPTKVGILALNRGAFQPLLTGYIQELLAGATLATDLGSGSATGFGMASGGSGYWIAGTQGYVIPFEESTPYYGSMANQLLNKIITGMAVKPGGTGYWLVGEDGGVFSYGAAGFYGSEAGLVLSSPVSDIEPTPSGNGYWLVAQDGGVFAHGDAGFFGSGVGVVSDLIYSISATPSGLGYFLLAVDGNVYAFGDAVWDGNSGVDDSRVIIAFADDGYWVMTGDGSVYALGTATFYGGMTGTPLNAPIRDAAKTPTGLGYWMMGADGGVFSFGDAVFHGSIPGGAGVANQYTLHKDEGRLPVIRLKDKLTEHWSVTVGTPGVKHSLSRDFTMSPNAIYAEGTDPDGCHWRNSKYPQLSNLDSAFFLPLAEQTEVEPYLYDQNGVVLDSNPLFDPSRVRVEQYTNLGDMVTKYEGIQSVRSDLYRNSRPSYQGEIVLEIDPEEGSRFDIRAGQNIRLKGYKGGNPLFHIAKVALDFDGLTANLTVDQKAQDLLTLSAVESRDRDTVEASRKFKPSRRHSTQVEDRLAVFDCEAGAGKVRQPVADAGWYLWQVPFAERGLIMKTYIAVGAPTEDDDVSPVAVDFAVGIFSKFTVMEELVYSYPDGPFVLPTGVDPDANPNYNPWDSWGYDQPIMAWGSPSEHAGFWPGNYEEGATPTGVLKDDAQWYYKADYPPWLWIAFWFNGTALPGAVIAHMDFIPGVLAAN